VFTISHSATHTDAHTHTPRAARFKAQCGTSARQRYRSTREIERIRSLCARHSTPRLHVWNDAHRRVCAARGVAQCRRCTRSRTRSSFAHTCEVCVRDMRLSTHRPRWLSTHTVQANHISRARMLHARAPTISRHTSRVRVLGAARPPASSVDMHLAPARAMRLYGRGSAYGMGGAAASLLPDACSRQCFFFAATHNRLRRGRAELQRTAHFRTAGAPHKHITDTVGCRKRRAHAARVNSSEGGLRCDIVCASPPRGRLPPFGRRPSSSPLKEWWHATAAAAASTADLHTGHSTWRGGRPGRGRPPRGCPCRSSCSPKPP